MESERRNKKIALYTTLEVIALFTLTVVGSMWDWVDMRFTLSKITTSEYWSDVIIQTIMYSCALILFNLLKLEKLELNNQEYANLLKSYSGKDENEIFTGALKYKDDGFEKYVYEVLNPSIKKKFLKKKYETKLAMLEKISRDSYQLEYDKVEDYLLIDGNKIENYTFKNRHTKHYYFRRKELELLKSDEYINKHYQSMYVRYPKVNPYTFTEYLNIKTNDRTMYQTTNKTARDVSTSLTRKFIYSILGAIVIGMLLINPSASQLLEQANGWIALMIQYIIRVGMITANSVMGIYNAKRIFRDNFLRPISNRIRMLNEYNYYKLENKWQSKADIEREIKQRIKEQVEPIMVELDKLEKQEKLGVA